MIPGVGNATANKVFETIATGVRTTYGSGWFKTELKGDGQVLNTEDINEGQNHNLQPPATAGGSDLIARLRSFAKGRSRKPFDDFVRLLEILVQEENRNNPAKQIEIVLTNSYEQYLVENFENAEARLEDLKGLALYAQRYTTTDEFLSELALALDRTVQGTAAARRRRSRIRRR